MYKNKLPLTSLRNRHRSVSWCSTMANCCNSRKRRRSASSDWSGLHSDLLGSILNRLSFVDIVCFGAVCPSWLSVAKSHTSSTSPILMLPGDLGEEERHNLSSWSEHDYTSSCFYSLSGEECYTLSSNQWKLGRTRCIGSFHGSWLILSEDQPYIYNPFRGVSIQLPSLRSFPGFTGNVRKDIYSHTDNDDDLQVEYLLLHTLFPQGGWLRARSLKTNFINIKAVLSSDPCRSKSCCTFLSVVYNDQSRLAFCRIGDSKWTDLQAANKFSFFYMDVIWRQNHLYALSHKASVEIWDLAAAHRQFP